MSHQIRLRAAWLRSVGSETVRVDLPDILVIGEPYVSYVRTFNAPSGVDSETSLFLVLERWLGELDVSLDGRLLASGVNFCGEKLSISLTGQLHGFHKLEVVLRDDGNGVQLIGPCCLVIEET